MQDHFSLSFAQGCSLRLPGPVTNAHPPDLAGQFTALMSLQDTCGFCCSRPPLNTRVSVGHQFSVRGSREPGQRLRSTPGAAAPPAGGKARSRPALQRSPAASASEARRLFGPGGRPYGEERWLAARRGSGEAGGTFWKPRDLSVASVTEWDTQQPGRVRIRAPHRLVMAVPHKRGSALRSLGQERLSFALPWITRAFVPGDEGA